MRPSHSQLTLQPCQRCCTASSPSDRHPTVQQTCRPLSTSNHPCCLRIGSPAKQTLCERRLKILNHQLAIPDFHGFSNDLTALYHLVEGDTSGNNADYIPILRCISQPVTVSSCIVASHKKTLTARDGTRALRCRRHGMH